MQEPNLTNRNVIVQVSKPIKWVGSESIRTEHATNLVVQQRGSEFTFLFFEAEPPLFTGTPEEQSAAYRDLQEITAKCVAKVVMSAENAVEAANNIIDSLNKFNSMIAALKGEENAETPGNTELSPTS